MFKIKIISKGGNVVRSAILVIFLLLVGIFSFASQFVTLSASPTYLLAGGSVRIAASLSSTLDVKSVVLKIRTNASTFTLYNPTVSGKDYVWDYVTPNSPEDFEAQAEVSFNSTSTEELSNIATFTTNIPAASVESTIVYVPFITASTQTWKVNVENVGSKSLNFTTVSSPAEALKITPAQGEISPGDSIVFTVTNNAFLLPGKIHILDAFVKTNDPRANMSKLLLIRIIEGPDGIAVSPVHVSHERVAVGSDVNFGFSVFHNGITLEKVDVIWNCPNGSKAFHYSVDKTYFSSDFRVDALGIYKLSSIMITYVYKNVERELILSPNVEITTFSSSKDMVLDVGKDDVEVNITSQTTPTLHVEDGEIDEILNLKRTSTSNWRATYAYSKRSGPVTFYATFSDVNYVISRTFNRYIANSQSTSFFFNDSGWVTVQKDTFTSTSMIVLFSKSIDEESYYKGFQNFTPVSNKITLVSDSTPLKNFIYHLKFSLSLVNGLFDDLKLYKSKNGKWTSDDATLTVQQYGEASFYEKDGTYVLGISPSVQPSSRPIINSFAIIPRKSSGTNIQFFLSVDKDCYYRLEIYDMRSRIVVAQNGQAIGKLSTLLYTLDPNLLPNGLYVAVISVGSSPNALSDSCSRSFAIVK